jgi:hypothetical protein
MKRLLAFGLLACAIALGAEAPNTVVLAPSSSTLTDAAGNVWGISPAPCTATWAAAGTSSVVTINGAVDVQTCSVKAIAYVPPLVWQENASGFWYSKTSPTAQWIEAVPPTTSPVTVVTPPAPTATLTWVAPTLYTNGAAITGNLTYNVYQGLCAGTLAKVQSGITGLTVVITAGLTAGSNQGFAVTAVTAASVESAQSTPTCKAFPAAVLTPAAPVLNSVT